MICVASVCARADCLRVFVFCCFTWVGLVCARRLARGPATDGSYVHPCTCRCAPALIFGQVGIGDERGVEPGARQGPRARRHPVVVCVCVRVHVVLACRAYQTTLTTSSASIAFIFLCWCCCSCFCANRATDKYSRTRISSQTRRKKLLDWLAAKR
jgi:hypothetical protein